MKPITTSAIRKRLAQLAARDPKTLDCHPSQAGEDSQEGKLMKILEGDAGMSDTAAKKQELLDRLYSFRAGGLPIYLAEAIEQYVLAAVAEAIGKLATQKRERKPREARPDPLATLPALSRFFPRLLALIAEEHPATAKRLPAEGSKAWIEWRGEIERIVRLDKTPEGEVVAALTWLFDDDHPDADFWRQQVQAVGGLRKVKSGQTLSKFDRILDKWRRATGGRLGGMSGGMVQVDDEDQVRQIAAQAGVLPPRRPPMPPPVRRFQG